MKANAETRELNGKFSSIKSPTGGEEKKRRALQSIPRMVLQKEISGFRLKELLMIAVLIAPLVATTVVWIVVY